MDATVLAEYLVRKGIPFRQAHHVVGTLVALAEQSNKAINRLTVEEFRSASDLFVEDVYETFDLQKALRARNITGAPGQVKKQLARWTKLLSKS